ncbi:MAG: peptidyl-prolyl cis-trans isomerase, partial [Aeoliella sp.]
MLKIDIESAEVESAEVEACPPPSQSGITQVLREPLLHFVLIGAAIYLLFGLLGQSDHAAEDENTIVVTEGEVNWLAQMWQKKWNRPPSDVEMLGLVRDHLRETVLYREAVAMGLDKDDVIIRRRMAQKLEFLAQDLIQPEEPTEEKLQAYFEENIERYQIPPLLTFTHVFLDPDKRGDDTLTDAEKLKTELIASATVPNEASDLGDRFMLQAYYPERDEADLAKLFGGEFASSIMTLEPEKWHGPVLSGYGTHLVYVHARLESPPPTFEQVAERVREDLVNEQLEKLNQEYLDSLLALYNFVISGEYPYFPPP